MLNESKNTKNMADNKTIIKYSFNDIEYFKPKKENNEIGIGIKKGIYLIVSVILAAIITFNAVNTFFGIGSDAKNGSKSSKVSEQISKQKENYIQKSNRKISSGEVKSDVSNPYKQNNNYSSFGETKRLSEDENKKYSIINKEQNWEGFYEAFPHVKDIGSGSSKQDVLDTLGRSDGGYIVNGIEYMYYRDFAFKLDADRQEVEGFYIRVR